MAKPKKTSATKRYRTFNFNVQKDIGLKVDDILDQSEFTITQVFEQSINFVHDLINNPKAEEPDFVLLLRAKRNRRAKSAQS